VHDQHIAQALGLHARSGGTERTQADGDVEDAVGAGANGRQRRGGSKDESGFVEQPASAAANDVCSSPRRFNITLLASELIAA
jgi:hypothetical protein